MIKSGKALLEWKIGFIEGGALTLQDYSCRQFFVIQEDPGNE